MSELCHTRSTQKMYNELQFQRLVSPIQYLTKYINIYINMNKGQESFFVELNDGTVKLTFNIVD